jgi:hypothetical protein
MTVLSRAVGSRLPMLATALEKFCPIKSHYVSRTTQPHRAI